MNLQDSVCVNELHTNMLAFYVPLVLTTTTVAEPIHFTSAQFSTVYEYSRELYQAPLAIDGLIDSFAISGSTANTNGQTLSLNMGSPIDGPVSVRIRVNIPGVIRQWMAPLQVYLGNSAHERAFECERDVVAEWSYQCLHPLAAHTFITVYLPSTSSNTWMVINEVEAVRNVNSIIATTEPARDTTLDVISTNRSAVLHIPERRRNQMLPLVVFLHPYTYTGTYWYDLYIGSSSQQESPKMHIVAEGTRDRNNYPFWNATDACCNLDNAVVDDVAYVESLVRQAIRYHNADPDNVMIVGMSNGGFMVHRLICELPTLFSLAISINGASWQHRDDCPALRRRVGVFPTLVHVNSNADNVVPAVGGRVLPALRDYPSAIEVVHRWKTASGCRAYRQTTSHSLLHTGDAASVDENFNCTRSNKVIGITLLNQNHAPSFASDWFSQLLTLANVQRN